MAFTPAEIVGSFDIGRDHLPNMPGEVVEYHSSQLIRDEFLMNIQKFASNIQRTVQQLEGKSSFSSLSVVHVL